jgi:hypothetical protein
MSNRVSFLLVSSLRLLVLAGCSAAGGGTSGTLKVTYDANGASAGSVPIDSNVYAADDVVTVLGNTGTPPLSKNLVAHASSQLFRLVSSAQPQIGLSLTTLSFSANQGGANPIEQTISVTNAGSGTLDLLSVNVSYSAGSGWLNATLDSPNADTTLRVRPITGSLGGGTYSATITVFSGDFGVNPQTVAITFTVASLPQVVAPTFSPPAGSYLSAQSVTISTTTPGAYIRYTTDGSTPTSTVGTLYSGSINVGVSQTLKAIAYESGWAESTVATAAYTISGASYAFAGWNTRADGTGTTYAPGQTFIITSNVTLYAVWSAGAKFEGRPFDSPRVRLSRPETICYQWSGASESAHEKRKLGDELVSQIAGAWSRKS